LLLYYCGVRLGEAQQIRWDQVDLDEAVIEFEGDQTKNQEARSIPLPDVLVDILRALENARVRLLIQRTFGRNGIRPASKQGVERSPKLKERRTPSILT
jgi:integrase